MHAPVFSPIRSARLPRFPLERAWAAGEEKWASRPRSTACLKQVESASSDPLTCIDGGVVADGCRLACGGTRAQLLNDEPEWNLKSDDNSTQPKGPALTLLPRMAVRAWVHPTCRGWRGSCHCNCRQERPQNCSFVKPDHPAQQTGTNGGAGRQEMLELKHCRTDLLLRRVGITVRHHRLNPQG